jgi:hypothetical protein
MTGSLQGGAEVDGVWPCAVLLACPLKPPSFAAEAPHACSPQDVAKSISEQRVRGDELASKHKGRRDKAERMASVLAGVQTAVANAHKVVAIICSDITSWHCRMPSCQLACAC